MSKRKYGLIVVIIALLAVLFLPGIIFSEGQEEVMQIEEEVAQTQEENQVPEQTTPNKDLLDFLEQYLQDKMAQLAIPGLAFAVVDSEDIFMGAYGYSDVENQVSVDPARTIFPMEAISKVFTATAILQLAENGSLDLDGNINQYLSTFQTLSLYPRPITISNLLTHSSGYADDGIGIYAKDFNDVQSLQDYLPESEAKMVSPPGKLSIYGDFGFGLLGLAIQDITGLEFPEYMDTYILQPLAMKQSEFRRELDSLPDYAVGYREGAEGLEPHNPVYPRNVAARALTGTVKDMANYIMAQLNMGVFNENTILEQSGIKSMQQVQFAQEPRLPGRTFGFYEHIHNNKRIILHGGDSRLGYSNMMFIMPEDNFGMIIAINKFDPGFGLRLVNDYVDWRYPVTETEKTVAGIASGDRTQWFEGTYAYDYPVGSGFSKLSRLFTQVHVMPDEEDNWFIDFPVEMDLPSRWVEIEPLFFKALDTNDYLAFLDNDRGEITQLYAGGIYNFSKVAWYHTLEITTIIVIAFSAIFAVICLIWLLRKIRLRKVRGRSYEEYQYNMGALISLLNLLFIGGVLLYLRFYSLELLFEIPPLVYGLLVMPIIPLALTLIMCFIDSPFRRRRRSLISRLYNFLIKAANIAFFIYLWSWNLVGFW